MSFRKDWPEITREEVQATVHRDFTHDEAAQVLRLLNTLDEPRIQLAVLYKVKGNAKLIHRYITWDWKDIIASTDMAAVETYRVKRPLA